MRVLWIAAIVFCLGTGLLLARFLWPRELDLSAPPTLEITEVQDATPRIFIPDRVLVARLAEYDNSLSAYLMLDYYRSLRALSDTTVLLSSAGQAANRSYQILVRLPGDLVNGLSILAELKGKNLIPEISYAWVPRLQYERTLNRATYLMEAFQSSSPEKLERFSPEQLEAYVRRFIGFKSHMDPRLKSESPGGTVLLTTDQAGCLAADILAVSDFYDVPVALFLGIGAMENNFLNAPGDLNNTIWKKRAEPGDIVLRKSQGRVLVMNDSVGIWQITRRSLRYAQQLYSRDKRDYSRLPERLRPPATMDWTYLDPNSSVLTTYAGLLLRDLLDQTGGDMFLAAGSYNGSLKNPNFRYAEGVQLVANYARRVIANAAELDGLSVSPEPLQRTEDGLESELGRVALSLRPPPSLELTPIK